MIKRIMRFLKRIDPGPPTAAELTTPIIQPREIPFKGNNLNTLRKQAKPLKPVIKVAIDESIGNGLARRIEEKGYMIVCRAGHAETDDSWMKRAKEKGAVFIISPDLDIPSMIERENLPMVWIDFLFAQHVNPTLNALMTKDQKHTIWSQYLHDRIQAKLKFMRKEFGEIQI